MFVVFVLFVVFAFLVVQSAYIKYFKELDIKHSKEIPDQIVREGDRVEEMYFNGEMTIPELDTEEYGRVVELLRDCALESSGLILEGAFKDRFEDFINKNDETIRQLSKKLISK